MSDVPQNLSDRQQVLKKQTWRSSINTTDSLYIHFYSTKHPKCFGFLCVLFFLCLLACFFHVMLIFTILTCYCCIILQKKNRFWEKKLIKRNGTHVIAISMVGFLTAFISRANRCHTDISHSRMTLFQCSYYNCHKPIWKMLSFVCNIKTQSTEKYDRPVFTLQL